LGEKVPATFWGVLAGSFFTLLCLFFSNKHDFEMKKVEKDYVLKKEIYLKAAESISIKMNLLGQMADINFPQEKLSESLNGTGLAMGNVSLIAGKDTYKALQYFNVEYTATFLRVAAKRFPLVSKVRQRDFAMEQAKDQGMERSQLLRFQRDQILSGRIDEQQLKTIESMFKYAGDQHDKLLSEHSSLNRELATETFDFIRECYSEIQKLSKCITPLIASFRSELNIPFDVEFHERVTSEMFSKASQDLEDFIRSVSPLIKKV